MSLIMTFEHPWSFLSGSNYITSIAFSPNGSKIATGSHQARIWDLRDGSLMREIEASKASYYDSKDDYEYPLTTSIRVAFSPDGSMFAETDGVDTKIFNAKDWSLTRMWKGLSSMFLVFSPDSKKIVLSGGGKILILDVNTGSLIKALNIRGSMLGEGGEVVFSPDGMRLFSRTNRNIVRIWSVTDWLLLKRWMIKDDKPKSVTFSSDCKKLSSFCYRSKIVNILGTDRGSLIRKLEEGTPVLDAALSPDGTRLALSTEDQKIRLWSLVDGSLVKEFLTDKAVDHITFSPDGSKLALAHVNTCYLYQI